MNLKLTYSHFNWYGATLYEESIGEVDYRFIGRVENAYIGLKDVFLGDEFVSGEGIKIKILGVVFNGRKELNELLTWLDKVL